MSSNILISYYKISNTIYVTIRDEAGKVWNTSSQAFETWNDSSIANYVVNATYKEGSLYIAGFPTTISSGYYTVMVFLQGGGSPSVAADVWLGSTDYYWDKINTNLVKVRVDTLSIAGAVSINHDTEQTVIERETSPSTITILRESNPS